MDAEYLRQRVRHFLMKEANARSGGDLNYNPGLLLGDGRKRKVGRPTKAAVARRVKVAKAKKVKRVGGAAKGNIKALSAWRHYFEKYRRAHPNMDYRTAQKAAAAEYKRR